MHSNNALVAFYPSHTAAEAAIKHLRGSGLGLKRISVVGPGYHDIAPAAGASSAVRMRDWGRTSAFWSLVWGFGLGSAFFWIPSLRPLLVMGLLFGWIFCTREGAVIAGSLSALHADLYSLGISGENILRYETRLKSGKFALIAQGSWDDTSHAKEILHHTQPEILTLHR